MNGDANLATLQCCYAGIGNIFAASSIVKARAAWVNSRQQSVEDG